MTGNVIQPIHTLSISQYVLSIYYINFLFSFYLNGVDNMEFLLHKNADLKVT